MWMMVDVDGWDNVVDVCCVLVKVGYVVVVFLKMDFCRSIIWLVKIFFWCGMNSIMIVFFDWIWWFMFVIRCVGRVFWMRWFCCIMSVMVFCGLRVFFFRSVCVFFLMNLRKWLRIVSWWNLINWLWIWSLVICVWCFRCMRFFVGLMNWFGICVFLVWCVSFLVVMFIFISCVLMINLVFRVVVLIGILILKFGILRMVCCVCGLLVFWLCLLIIMSLMGCWCWFLVCIIILCCVRVLCLRIIGRICWKVSVWVYLVRKIWLSWWNRVVFRCLRDCWVYCCCLSVIFCMCLIRICCFGCVLICFLFIIVWIIFWKICIVVINCVWIFLLIVKILRYCLCMIIWSFCKLGCFRFLFFFYFEGFKVFCLSSCYILLVVCDSGCECNW